MGAQRTGRNVACLVGVLFAAAGCSVLPAPVVVGPAAVSTAEAPGSSALSSAVSEQWATGMGLDGVHVPADLEPDWIEVASHGNGFAYINVSEGNRRLNASFADQAAEARAAGLLVGGWHVARPDQSSGKTQGRLFASSGGGWKPDGRTLPGIVEFGGGEARDCSGLDPAAMIAWVSEFAAEYRRFSGRVPVLATSASWWATCVGSDERLSDLNLALRAEPGEPAESPTVPALPTGWTQPTLWLQEKADGACGVTFFGTTEDLDRWAVSAQR